MNGNNNQHANAGGNPMMPNNGGAQTPYNANKGGAQTPSLSAVNSDKASEQLGNVKTRQAATPSGKRAEDYKRENISSGGLKDALGLSKSSKGGSQSSSQASIDANGTSNSVSGNQRAGNVEQNIERNRKNRINEAKVRLAKEAVKKYAAAHGVPEGVAEKALNSKTMNDALAKKLNRKGLGARALDALNNRAGKSMDSANKPDSEKTSEEKGEEEERRKISNGEINFSVPPKIIKLLIIVAPACFLVLFTIVIILVLIDDTKTSSMILGELSASEKIELAEQVTSLGTGDYGTGVGMLVDGKNYPDEYFERLSYLGNNYTSRAKCVDKNDCMSTNEFLYYLKVSDLALRYKNKYNINLDWSLIVATDLYLTKSTEDSMADNLSNYDKNSVKNYDTLSELDWENDFKKMQGYVYLNASDSRYDLNILAKNMVKKKTTQTCTDSEGNTVKRQEDEDVEDVYLNSSKKLYCEVGQTYTITSTYTKDLDKYDDFMLEYIEKKMLTPGYGNHAGENCVITSTSTGYIWPIGSKETTQSDGKTFALGDPVSTGITSTFGSQESFRTSGHGGVDIADSGSGAGVDYVIAAKDGKVIYPTEKSQTTFADNGYYGNTDGDGYGNYVIIQHSDGLYTLYGHLAKSSITVMAGEEVKQGQVIGKLGHSGSSTGPHLHFEMRNGNGTSNERIDPLKYINQKQPRSGTSMNCGPAASGLADAFVKLALEQKNDPSASGGQKYWSLWFGSRVAWCACFVSWNIANTEYNGEKLSDIFDLRQEGKPGNSCVFEFMNWAYRSTNPNVKFVYNDNCSSYAGKNGSGTYTPKQGDLIFFDWAASWSGQMPTCYDCGPDHIGIVQKTEGGVIYTIEGNSGDAVRENTYELNSCKVIGFASWY